MSLVECLIETIKLRQILVQKQFDETEIEQIFDAISESSIISDELHGD